MPLEPPREQGVILQHYYRRGRASNSHLLQDDALGHGRATEGVGLHRCDGVGLVVVLRSKHTHTPRQI